MRTVRHGRSSGHDSDRPLAGSHQPDRHRANKPVASLGRRPDDDSLRAYLIGHTAQLRVWVAAPGHEGDGDAPLLGLLFDLAAQVVGGPRRRPRLGRRPPHHQHRASQWQARPPARRRRRLGGPAGGGPDRRRTHPLAATWGNRRRRRGLPSGRRSPVQTTPRRLTSHRQYGPLTDNLGEAPAPDHPVPHATMALAGAAAHRES